MDSARLKNFLTIAECGSLSEAAKRLFLTQPTLSQQIKQLEEERGEKLFERNGRSMELTTAGKIYADFAQKTLSAYENTLFQLNALKHGMNESLGIGFAQSSMIDEVADWTSELMRDNPNIQCRVSFEHLDALLEKMRLGELDVVISRKIYRTSEFIKNFDYLKIGSDNVILATKDDSIFGDREAISFKELDKQDLILRVMHERSFMRRCEQEGISVNVRCICGLSYFKVRLICNGIGMAFFPQCCLKMIREAGLKYYRLRDFEVARKHYLIFPNNKRTKALEKLIEIVQEKTSLY